jgi:hypothetical protein
VRLGVQLECYVKAVWELAAEVPEFAALAKALDDQNSGISAPLLQPRKLPRQNKPEPYLDLALYAATAFSYAACDLYKKGEELIFDRVMAEVFGESRTGTEDYADRLGEPWLLLCGRSWGQARFLLETGLSLLGWTTRRPEPIGPERQIFDYVILGFEPTGALVEIARRRSTLGADKAAATAAWTAAGVTRSKR